LRGHRRSLRRADRGDGKPRHRWLLSPVERAYSGMTASRRGRAAGRARFARSAARPGFRSRTSSLLPRREHR
jgi:hypothetical protein